MRLFPIYAAGVQAYCSDIIVDPEDQQTVYFLSVCGYQVAVKGIMANLLENHGLSVHVDGIGYYLIRSDFGYKMIVKKLPSGLVHAMLFPQAALPKNDENGHGSFFIFTDRNRDKKTLHLFYRHLDEKTDIPLHPSWGKWLWGVFTEQENWLVELNSLVGTFCGYLFRLYPKQLHDIISTAIRQKQPQVAGCLVWKGDNLDGKPHIA